MQLRASATDGRIQRALLIAVAVVCVISMGSSAAASESQVPTEGGVATLQDCFVQKKRLMAVVLVDGDDVESPHYIRRPFTQEPDWAVTSINLDLNELLGRSTAPCA